MWEVLYRHDVATHEAVFEWVLKRIANSGLLRGKTIGIDATTLEANAALRSIVRRDSGQGYDGLAPFQWTVSRLSFSTRDSRRCENCGSRVAASMAWSVSTTADARLNPSPSGQSLSTAATCSEVLCRARRTWSQVSRQHPSLHSKSSRRASTPQG